MTAELHIRAGSGGEVTLTHGGTHVASGHLFRIGVDGLTVRTYDAGMVTDRDRCAASGTVSGTQVHARWTADQIGEDVWELGLRLRNDGPPTVVTGMDPVAFTLHGEAWQVLSFHSAWGEEFEPERRPAGSPVHIETRSGRSSHGHSPLVGLSRGRSSILVAPAWSGNWHVDVDQSGTLTAGISPWRFAAELGTGESIDAPSVVIAVGGSVDEAGVRLASAIGHGWMPRSAASDRLDPEWNHWWPYEDADVSEDVILANAEVAGRLGIEYVTVDAGWFGPSAVDSFWQRHRGDWDQVNLTRFPAGLVELGDRIRAEGLRPGIWIEPEAVGAEAALRRSRPDLLALDTSGRPRDPSYHPHTDGLDPDDPSFLGYVCCGSPEGRRFVLESIEAAVAAIGAEWVKLDFNLDPGSGCTRTDHGHGGGDGLYRHYLGLYDLLDEFRMRHPDVVVESCASGGLRVDLGLARHVHCMFLSDPDYTEHALSVLWGASLMLPPSGMLHWSWSQWRGDHPPNAIDFDTLTDDEFTAMLRAAMLHRFGVSLRLPDLPERLTQILAEQVEVYRTRMVPLVAAGTLHRLGGQPLRAGRGERSPAFQLSASDRHAMAAFRLPGAEGQLRVKPQGLDPDAVYLCDDGHAAPTRTTGAALMREGLPIPERTGRLASALLFVARDTSAPDPGART